MSACKQVPEAPKEAMVFMEDLPEDQQDVSGMGKYGAGKLPRPALKLDYCQPADCHMPASPTAFQPQAGIQGKPPLHCF